MRLVTWAEFQILPVGTVFQEHYAANHDLGGLMILGGVYSDRLDFVAADLLPACVQGDNLEKGHELKGEADIISMPSGHGRDAMYDMSGRRWLIWEDADRARLAQWLMDPVTGANEQNTDDVLMVVPELQE